MSVVNLIMTLSPPQFVTDGPVICRARIDQLPARLLSRGRQKYLTHTTITRFASLLQLQVTHVTSGLLA